MTGTTAVPLEPLAAANRSATGQPLCPACHTGFLHPYFVELTLPPEWVLADYLNGWVAVCVGDRYHNEATAKLYTEAGETIPEDLRVNHEPCGFSMPMTPHRRPGPTAMAGT